MSELEESASSFWPSSVAKTSASNGQGDHQGTDVASSSPPPAAASTSPAVAAVAVAPAAPPLFLVGGHQRMHVLRVSPLPSLCHLMSEHMHKSCVCLQHPSMKENLWQPATRGGIMHPGCTSPNRLQPDGSGRCYCLTGRAKAVFLAKADGEVVQKVREAAEGEGHNATSARPFALFS